VTSLVVGRLDDLPDPGAREFVILGDRPLRGFVVRKGANVFAYVNRCPHAGQPLNRTPDGFLDSTNRLILCRTHGAMFDIESGVCVEGMCVGEALQRLVVRVCDGVISLDCEAPR
jgi:nitrite reductase/ring-hydroxylating ferredoxin subunit